MVRSPQNDLAKGGRAEGFSRLHGRDLFDEEDAIARVARDAVVGQRTEDRVIAEEAEEAEDQGLLMRTSPSARYGSRKESLIGDLSPNFF
jgi:hypothetical protein